MELLGQRSIFGAKLGNLVSAFAQLFGEINFFILGVPSDAAVSCAAGVSKPQTLKNFEPADFPVGSLPLHLGELPSRHPVSQAEPLASIALHAVCVILGMPKWLAAPQQGGRDAAPGRAETPASVSDHGGVAGLEKLRAQRLRGSRLGGPYDGICRCQVELQMRPEQPLVLTCWKVLVGALFYEPQNQLQPMP